MTNDIHVVFDDRSYDLLPAKVIGRMCFDLESLWRMVRMLAGHSDFAILKITKPEHGDEDPGRMAVFMNEPPFNWKFPDEPY